MSGTSLDGLDLCLVHFYFENKQWRYKIVDANCLEYAQEWKEKLLLANQLKAIELIELDRAYGQFLGKCCYRFLGKQKVDFIASHGHTVFHQPHKGLTLQIGHGGEIASHSKRVVVCDFRSQDISLGGQGAPLVPFGDQELFKQYDACINIGGISNISFDQEGKRIAFDVAPSNMIINELCQKHFNLDFDKNGEIAKKGKIDQCLYEQLENIGYYQKEPPKSLGKEDIDRDFMPLFEATNITVEDQLFTFYQHWANQITKTLSENQLYENILISGGGAKNTFLIKGLLEKFNISVPDEMVLEYKEALIFAFLGLYRLEGKNNVLSTVTGASRSHSAGAVFLP
ncbi:MAG: anhydro-N-acetylmuramic acid kinase [Vicingaceae bacterium]